MATGLAARDGGVDAFAEAASRAQLGLGGARADLVAVFAGSANLETIEDGLAAVEARLGSRALMGCGAQGVLGDGREVEHGTAISVWAASLGAGTATAFRAGAPEAELRAARGLGEGVHSAVLRRQARGHANRHSRIFAALRRSAAARRPAAAPGPGPSACESGAPRWARRRRGCC